MECFPLDVKLCIWSLGFQVALVGRKLSASARDVRAAGSIPASGGSPEGGHPRIPVWRDHGQTGLAGCSPWSRRWTWKWLSAARLVCSPFLTATQKHGGAFLARCVYCSVPCKCQLSLLSCTLVFVSYFFNEWMSVTALGSFKLEREEDEIYEIISTLNK